MTQNNTLLPRPTDHDAGAAEPTPTSLPTHPTAGAPAPVGAPESPPTGSIGRGWRLGGLIAAGVVALALAFGGGVATGLSIAPQGGAAGGGTLGFDQGGFPDDGVRGDGGPRGGFPQDGTMPDDGTSDESGSTDSSTS